MDDEEIKDVDEESSKDDENFDPRKARNFMDDDDLMPETDDPVTGMFDEDDDWIDRSKSVEDLEEEEGVDSDGFDDYDNR